MRRNSKCIVRHYFVQSSIGPRFQVILPLTSLQWFPWYMSLIYHDLRHHIVKYCGLTRRSQVSQQHISTMWWSHCWINHKPSCARGKDCSNRWLIIPGPNQPKIWRARPLVGTARSLPWLRHLSWADTLLKSASSRDLARWTLRRKLHQYRKEYQPEQWRPRNTERLKYTRPKE